ncbi:MAG: helix-turn-helix transcriptional regulator [Nitrospinae bacterium]|nr:helix-turn-helix transcriptional regulator [Nitrospinota bacterium]
MEEEMKITEEGELKNPGQRLRFWRKQRGMNASLFAATINLSPGSLSEIENGKSLPSAQTIIQLMELEELDVYWLLTGQRNVGHNIKVEQIKTLIDNLKKGIAVNRELETNLNELLHIVES